MKTVYFITHPEVVIDPAVPVPCGPLSIQGLARMRLLLRQPWVPQMTAVYCSTEQKASDGAALLAAHLALSLSVAGSPQRSPSHGLSVRSRPSLHRMPHQEPSRLSHMVGWGHYCCVHLQGMLLTVGMSNRARVGATITPSTPNDGYSGMHGAQSICWRRRQEQT